MSIVDSRNFSLPRRGNYSRKPLPQAPGAPASAQPPPSHHFNDIQPDQAYLPQHQHLLQRPQQQQQPLQSTPQYEQQQYAHSRSRTASSSVFPQESLARPPPQHVPYNPSHVQSPVPVNQYAPTQSRRTLSNATTSTASSTSWNSTPMRQNSGASTDLRRSASSTSSNSPTSYVALMRKQKATVWSDRTQHEDPRAVAKQRMAKERALREVTGTAPGTRVSTSGGSSLAGGVRSKIRHHGAPKALQYAPGAHPASGLPPRLSQNEIEEDDDDENYTSNPSHNRTGSGRSSLGGSGRVGSMGTMQAPVANQQDVGSTQGSPDQPSGIASAEETPVPGRFQGSDYFDSKQLQETSLHRAGSGGSSSTGRENSFGGLGALPERTKPEGETLDPAELRRRGSVDERTMTMSGYGKLFVANPDVDN